MSGALKLPPPGAELERFLTLLTPPGALTWRALHGELPWTNPPGGRIRHTPPGEQELRDILAANGVGDDLAQSYVIHGPHTAVMVASPRELDRNHGRPARSMAVAAEVDICRGELSSLSSLLDLTDHEHAGDTRSARRYLSRGRALFAPLGVWPWAHIDRWPHRSWCRDPAVVEPLASWHDLAWSRAAQRLVTSVRARNGRVSVAAMSLAESDAVRAFRGALNGLGHGDE